MSLSMNLRTLRIAEGITVDEVSAKTSIDAAVIRGIENGQSNANQEILEALALYYGVTIAVLVED